ncbi:hypothetical protein PTKIN_Ptkin05aG0167400 [Pterospermum kingtungense]
MDRLSIWFELHNIPLELFNQKGISCIASIIGVSLYTDKFTALRQRLVFAKVCIEVKAGCKISKEIKVVMHSGKIMKGKVVIPWMSAHVCIANCLGMMIGLVCRIRLFNNNIVKQDLVVENLIDLKGKSPMIQSVGLPIANKGVIVDVSLVVGSLNSKPKPHADFINRFEKLREEFTLEDEIKDDDEMDQMDKENDPLFFSKYA